MLSRVWILTSISRTTGIQSINDTGHIMHLFAMSDVSQNADTFKINLRKKNISDIIICLGQTVPFIFSSESNLGSG